MSEPSVLLSIEDGIATITLNRPTKLNAFDTDMLGRLDDAVRTVNEDTSVHGAIVTGTGRGFCSGRDLDELRSVNDDERARPLPHAGGHESSMFASLEVPSVAAVNGAAVGGGLGFVVQCDLIVCARGAKLKDGHLATGVVPSVAAWHIPRRIGAWRAMMFFAATGGIAAEQAIGIGLVDEVVEPEALLATARLRLEPFRDVDRELLRHVKRLAVEAPLATFETQMERVAMLRGLERRRRRD